MRIVLFEDLKYSNFYPASRLRNVAEIRTGRYTQKERVESEFECNVLLHSEREGFGNDISNGIDTLFINSRTVDIKSIIDLEFGSYIVNKDETLIAFRADKFLTQNNIEELNKIVRDIPLYEFIWDIIANIKTQLESDLHNDFNLGKILSNTDSSISISNPDNVYIGENVYIDSNVVIDTSNGPVYIEDNTKVMANTVIYGPTYIGRDSLIKPGSFIDIISAGNATKISGEIEESIFQGYSNKQHYGFLGHSYIGEWVNLGAGTTNSDLKNNYSNIRVNLEGNIYETGMQFLGVLMGDHSKTAINTSFNTGTIIEPFCNIFSSGFPPKYLPPFSWWSGNFDEYILKKALKTSKKVMKRRNVNISENYINMIKKLFEDTIELRKNWE